MVNYLAKFIKHLALEAKILHDLEHKDVDWKWTKLHQEAFERLKLLIPEETNLRYFNPDLNITIQCDASSYGLGACLFQNDQPIQYASRALTKTEQNYP